MKRARSTTNRGQMADDPQTFYGAEEDISCLALLWRIPVLAHVVVFVILLLPSLLLLHTVLWSVLCSLFYGILSFFNFLIDIWIFLLLILLLFDRQMNVKT